MTAFMYFTLYHSYPFFTYFLFCFVSVFFFVHQFCLITHTQTHLTALFPGLPRWASTRKVKPIWILLKQETVIGSGISLAICKFAPRSPHTDMFNGPFSGTTQVSQYQKGKTNLDFIEARVAVASAGPYASLHLAPDRQPCQHPTTQFLQAGFLSCRATKSTEGTHCLITHTHTHPFNGPFSRTTRVGRYQKGKTNLDFAWGGGVE